MFVIEEYRFKNVSLLDRRTRKKVVSLLQLEILSQSICVFEYIEIMKYKRA